MYLPAGAFRRGSFWKEASSPAEQQLSYRALAVARTDGAMQRQLAAAAILLGTVGVLPFLLTVAMHLGLLPPAFIYEAVWWTASYAGGGPVAAIVSLLVAPTLLLWGLIAFQRTDRGRARIITGAILVCLCTAPFGYGVILCVPIFLCVMLPLMRRFKAARGAIPPEPP